jgi:hypothetical protein
MRILVLFRKALVTHAEASYRDGFAHGIFSPGLSNCLGFRRFADLLGCGLVHATKAPKDKCEAGKSRWRGWYPMADKEEAMTATQYSLLAALIFAVVAVLQFVRSAAGLPITIGRTSIPIWASWVACGVATVLAWLGYVASQG